MQSNFFAEDEGVEPTDGLLRQGLANLCLSRSAYPPTWVLYQLTVRGTKHLFEV